MNDKPKADEFPEYRALSEESVEYLRTRPKVERSPLGQFLTPRVLREALVSNVPLTSGMRVLDPGVGTGEFLKTCSETCSGLDLTGWDIDEQALNVARRLVPYATLIRRSALTQWEGQNFDVVIGNPPYFEIRDLETSLRNEFADVIGGRPNIFSLFFKAGWRVLKEGGFLAYVVPPSMNNGAYFDRLRTFILSNFSIDFLEVYESPFLFEDAQTAVQLIVLRKGRGNERHWVDLGRLSNSPVGRKVFVSDSDEFAREFAGRPTLYHLGYKAVTGSVVWNMRRDDLSRSPRDGTVPLIWAHNISEAEHVVLYEDHPKKPQHVFESKFLVGPAIVVNRITGSVGSGSLRCALVPPGAQFVGENHVNVIVKRDDADQQVGWHELLAALRSPGINGRVRQLTGNTQISATELTNWIPLDVRPPQRENGPKSIS